MGGFKYLYLLLTKSLATFTKGKTLVGAFSTSPGSVKFREAPLTALVQMFHANMTPTEEYETGRYYFGLGATTPYSWGVAQVGCDWWRRVT